jgi:hypothetical protein
VNTSRLIQKEKKERNNRNKIDSISGTNFLQNKDLAIEFIYIHRHRHRHKCALNDYSCFYCFTGSSPAAPAPTTAMIMEGLETLVTPSHHAYLLTESAAAAHFNVLSFDTCSLFKTAATTASSFNLNNNNHTIANNNHHPSQTQLMSSQSHHHHQQQQQQMQQPTTQQTSTVNTSSSNSSIITSSHSSTSVTQSSKTDSTIVSSTITTTTSSTSGHHSHPTLNIQETQSQTADRIQHQQTGDLNTPVTTSSDIPSFFGPSTVVEPPIITGM